MNTGEISKASMISEETMLMILTARVSASRSICNDIVASAVSNEVMQSAKKLVDMYNQLSDVVDKVRESGKTNTDFFAAMSDELMLMHDRVEALLYRHVKLLQGVHGSDESKISTAIADQHLLNSLRM